MSPTSPAGATLELRRLGAALEGSIHGEVRRRRRTLARRWMCAAAVGTVATIATRGIATGHRRAATVARPPATAMTGGSGTIAVVPDSPQPPASATGGADAVVPDPGSTLVLVNKEHRLPPGWEPPDLVVPDVAFTFAGWHPKRQLRQVAATALEALFAAAAADGVPLAGVSGFRSEATQRELFDRYVARDGEAAASRYSARPGHSEHQTGLAIDVSGLDGRCQAEPCFADTPAGRWLARSAPDFGFVVRYPDGKERVTGYMYEPWHLRYVGVPDAQAMARDGRTLEEHLA